MLTDKELEELSQREKAREARAALHITALLFFALGLVLGVAAPVLMRFVVPVVWQYLKS